MSESTSTDYAAQYKAEIAAVIAAEKAALRTSMIQGIHAMADFLESHPNVEMPYSLCASVYAENAEQARAMTHLSGTWPKSYDDYSVTYTKRFNESASYGGSIRLQVIVQREQVCQRVEVGIRHVEAQVIEAHDEPIYEWICSDSDE